MYCGYRNARNGDNQENCRKKSQWRMYGRNQIALPPGARRPDLPSRAARGKAYCGALGAGNLGTFAQCAETSQLRRWGYYTRDQVDAGHQGHGFERQVAPKGPRDRRTGLGKEALLRNINKARKDVRILGDGISAFEEKGDAVYATKLRGYQKGAAKWLARAIVDYESRWGAVPELAEEDGGSDAEELSALVGGRNRNAEQEKERADIEQIDNEMRTWKQTLDDLMDEGGPKSDIDEAWDQVNLLKNQLERKLAAHTRKWRITLPRDAGGPSNAPRTDRAPARVPRMADLGRLSRPPPANGVATVTSAGAGPSAAPARGALTRVVSDASGGGFPLPSPAPSRSASLGAEAYAGDHDTAESAREKADLKAWYDYLKGLEGARDKAVRETESAKADRAGLDTARRSVEDLRAKASAPPSREPRARTSTEACLALSTACGRLEALLSSGTVDDNKAIERASEGMTAASKTAQEAVKADIALIRTEMGERAEEPAPPEIPPTVMDDIRDAVDTREGGEEEAAEALTSLQNRGGPRTRAATKDASDAPPTVRETRAMTRAAEAAAREPRKTVTHGGRCKNDARPGRKTCAIHARKSGHVAMSCGMHVAYGKDVKRKYDDMATGIPSAPVTVTDAVRLSWLSRFPGQTGAPTQEESKKGK
eukprot:jgi/Mesvir1/10351/Mv10552-RA.1